MINIKEIYDIINSEETEKILTDIGLCNNEIIKVCSYDREIKNYYKMVMKYLYKDKTPFSIFVRKDYSSMNNEFIPAPQRKPTNILLKRTVGSNKNLSLSQLLSNRNNPLEISRGNKGTWDDGIMHFSNLDGYSGIGTSLMECLYDYPDVYEKFETYLNDYGKDVFSKLKTEYKNRELYQILNSKTKVPLVNITEDETKILNIKHGAYICLSCYEGGIGIFVTNKNFNDKTIFNSRWHRLPKEANEKNSCVFEYIFLNNHKEEFKKAIDDFKRNEFKWAKEHQKFNEIALEIIEKYLVIEKM